MSVTKLQLRIVHQGLSFPIVVMPRFIKAQHVFTYFSPKWTEKALCICSREKKKFAYLANFVKKNLFLPRFVSLALFVCLTGVLGGCFGFVHGCVACFPSCTSLPPSVDLTSAHSFPLNLPKIYTTWGACSNFFVTCNCIIKLTFALL